LAAVSLDLLGLIISAFLMVAFVPLNNNAASDMLSSIIAFLIASLVVGYVFALRIQEESRTRAVGSVVVLSTFMMMVFMSIWIAIPSVSPWFNESLNGMFNTSGWSNYKLAAYTAFDVSVSVIIIFVVVFIGAYIGSMLRKSSSKTK